jgi:hypothetical protein
MSISVLFQFVHADFQVNLEGRLVSIGEEDVLNRTLTTIAASAGIVPMYGIAHRFGRKATAWR